jgi:hypothetical protein
LRSYCDIDDYCSKTMIFSKRALYVVAAFFYGFQLVSQNTTQSIIFSEWNRSAQLSGLVSDSIPISLLKTTVFQDSLSAFTYSKKIVSKKNVELAILPLVQQYEFNSNYPFGWGNGSLKRSAGSQVLYSAGFSGSFGAVHFQIQPEWMIVQNKDYQGFPNEFPSSLWNRRFSSYYNRSDQPEKFGASAQTFRYLGQSDIHLSFFKTAVGVSHQRKNWGPGKQHGLILSNNAPGFLHAYLKSDQPMSIGIGQLSWEIFVGRLEGSGLKPVDTSERNNLFRAKRADWRYLSALNISFQPNFFPGLEVGFIRSVQQYFETTKANKEYLPLFISVTRTGTGGGADEIDQQASGYARLVLPKSGLEFYTELGRNDSPLNLRDILMAPQHSLAFIYGVIKQFNIYHHKMELGFEGVRMESSGTGRFRPEPEWYINGLIEHGYAHYGEFIGVGLPAGSNGQHLYASLLKNDVRVGVTIDRIENQMDFYRSITSNFPKANPWVDWAVGLTAQKQMKHWMIDAHMKYVRSFNYQWVQPATISSEPSLGTGKESNLFLRINTYFSF